MSGLTLIWYNPAARVRFIIISEKGPVQIGRLAVTSDKSFKRPVLTRGAFCVEQVKLESLNAFEGTKLAPDAHIS